MGLIVDSQTPVDAELTNGADTWAIVCVWDAGILMNNTVFYSLKIDGFKANMFLSIRWMKNDRWR